MSQYYQLSHCKHCGRPVVDNDGYWMHSEWGAVDGYNGLLCSMAEWDKVDLYGWQDPEHPIVRCQPVEEKRLTPTEWQKQIAVSRTECQQRIALLMQHLEMTD